MKIKGIILFLHGLPGWATKNYDIAEHLAQLGYKIIIPHYRGLGLGLSNEKVDLIQIHDDIKNIIFEIKQKNKRLPLSILGNSFGGFLGILNSH